MIVLISVFIAVIDTGSTCSRYAGGEGYYANVTDARSCYVVFPRRNSRAPQSWYEARNRCLLEGGDLAGRNATNLPLPIHGEYLIGLRRDAIVWIEPGKIAFINQKLFSRRNCAAFQ